ncbi:MAG: hypothetical protein EBU93_03785, partial [Chlamydiae bacterium]|nr:hypothetical protein [Chlamydiota bacterium]
MIYLTKSLDTCLIPFKAISDFCNQAYTNTCGILNAWAIQLNELKENVTARIYSIDFTFGVTQEKVQNFFYSVFKSSQDTADRAKKCCEAYLYSNQEAQLIQNGQVESEWFNEITKKVDLTKDIVLENKMTDQKVDNKFAISIEDQDLTKVLGFSWIDEIKKQESHFHVYENSSRESDLEQKSSDQKLNKHRKITLKSPVERSSVKLNPYSGVIKNQDGTNPVATDYYPFNFKTFEKVQAPSLKCFNIDHSSSFAFYSIEIKNPSCIFYVVEL